ncbi:MAG: sulfite oxidase-like oxidoreductase [Alphaproteobacteria bacterium]
MSDEDVSKRPRLPPGQRQVRDWPVLDLGVQPSLSLADWRFSVGGAVEAPLSWDWEAFMAQPQVTLTTDIHCVTTWSRFDNQWTGVSARHLLSLVRPRAEARFVVMRSHDGYTTNVPLAAFAAADVLLAHTWQGQPISREHGGPMRAVIPGLYFWKSAKWLRHITVLENDAPGYWEVRGYHNNGDPWSEERYG